jgi:hypothetical protein
MTTGRQRQGFCLTRAVPGTAMTLATRRDQSPEVPLPGLFQKELSFARTTSPFEDEAVTLGGSF